MKYDIITKEDISDLILSVNSRIKKDESWKPLGGITNFCMMNDKTGIQHQFFSQSIVQEVEESIFQEAEFDYCEWESGTIYQPGDVVKFNGEEMIITHINSSGQKTDSSCNEIPKK